MTAAKICPGGLPACSRNAAVDRHERDEIVLAVPGGVPRCADQVDARRKAHRRKAQYGHGVDAAPPAGSPCQQPQYARNQ